MVPTRRKALQLAGSTIVVSSLSGCLDLFQNGTIGVRIENRDDQEHTVDVVFKKDSEIVSDKQFTVPPGEENRTPDVVKAGSYTITAALDSSDSTSFEFDMQGCKNNSLYVSISDAGELEMSVLDEC